jgi:excisionase family DNA binding protein
MEHERHEYLTRLEAAAVLRTCDQTVDKRIKEGAITAVRVGRRVLIPRESLDAYLARCGVGRTEGR